MKNIKIYIFVIIALFVSILIFNSCNADSVDLKQQVEKKLSAKDYFGLLSHRSPGGSIVLQSNTSTTVQEIFRHASIQTSFDKNKQAFKKFMLVNKSTKETINQDSKVDPNTLYGGNYTYSLGENTKEGEENDVYVPELITAQFSSDVIMDGTTITWNVDSLNENGIVIWYEYDPLIQVSYTVIDQNREYKTGAVTIPDEGGSYTLTSSDIADIPNNTRIRYNISRAGYSFSENSEGQEISFMAVTTVGKEAKVER